MVRWCGPGANNASAWIPEPYLDDRSDEYTGREATRLNGQMRASTAPLQAILRHHDPTNYPSDTVQ